MYIKAERIKREQEARKEAEILAKKEMEEKRKKEMEEKIKAEEKQRNEEKKLEEKKKQELAEKQRIEMIKVENEKALGNVPLTDGKISEVNISNLKTNDCKQEINSPTVESAVRINIVLIYFSVEGCIC